MDDSRYVIGIDLGTTNSSVFYVDTEGAGRIEPFPVSQLVASGEVDAVELLPSFCYLPTDAERQGDLFSLPWDASPGHAVGILARDKGATLPNRLVSSAKSWLAHAGVDRRKPILPWGSDLEEGKASPIDVTCRYLSHVRRAWDHVFGKVRDKHGNRCLLERQQVTVTIPASFDETARELTLEAARDAGFSNLALLEEPLSAFYAWLNEHETDWRDAIAPGERILVIDVGGGTTDFSVIELDDTGGLHRFAVGDHLLLGGDNIDIALARRIEAEWGTTLSAADWSMLVQLCRRAKEDLLNGERDSADVTLLSRGSRVIGGARSATLTRDELMTLLDEGFYPFCQPDSPAPKETGGIREMGLPYAAEPAVTRHLLHFLKYAAGIAEEDGALYPDKILFNGGSMISSHVRERIVDAIAQWFPDRPASTILSSKSLSLAVAIGAAYYGRVRRGDGVRVRGGISRSYFIGAEAGADNRLICVISRDTDETVEVWVPGRYKLRTNEKVLFNLLSSATRLKDRPGDHIERCDEVVQVAPLSTALQFGKVESREIDVSIRSRLTEIGTLEISLHSGETDHVWPLRFDLRPRSNDSGPVDVITVDQARIDAALAIVRDAFTQRADRLPGLIKELERALELPRDQWPLALLRDLADTLLEIGDRRSVSARHEARWLNLMGYCMRPGFGDAGDALRMRKLWQLWFQGLTHGRDHQCNADFWVFWRRVAGGLGEGHQSQIAAAASKILMPKGKYRTKIKEGDQAQREMWRGIGAMEMLSIKNKRRIGRALLDRANQLTPVEIWAVGRLGSRRLFHGPADLVLPVADATAWAKTLLDARIGNRAADMRAFALTLIAARCGDRKRDFAEADFNPVRDFLKACDVRESWLNRLDNWDEGQTNDQAKILGDSLPLGLQIVAD